LTLGADLSAKADLTYVNDQLATKASQTSVADALAIKADQNSLDATNATVALKANQATTYTKTEVDTAISNIAIPTNLSVATIDSSDTLTDNIFISAHVIIDKNFAVHGASAIMSGNLSVDGQLATDSIRGRVANEVTIADNLKVTGTTVLDGNLDVGFNLTCGDIIANGIYGTAATQIQSNINTAISNYSPFWAAGRVAANGTIAIKKGRVDFSCARTAAGNYLITFAQPHPEGANYVIQLSSYVFFSQVNGSSVPTELNFRVRLTNANLQDTDSVFYFAVLA
jgi:hypothetical protein